MKKCFGIIDNGIEIGSISRDCSASEDYDIDTPWIISTLSDDSGKKRVRFKTLLDASRASKVLFSNSVLMVAD